MDTTIQHHCYAHLDGGRKSIIPLVNQQQFQTTYTQWLCEIQKVERRVFPRSEYTWPSRQSPSLSVRQHAIFAYIPGGAATTDVGTDVSAYPQPVTRYASEKTGEIGHTKYSATPQQAIVGTELIGYLLLQLDPARAQITKLAVEPAHRGMGVGSTLVNMATALCAERGRDRCELHVDTERADAQKVYQRCGFLQQGIVTDYYGPGRHAQVMRWTRQDHA